MRNISFRTSFYLQLISLRLSTFFRQKQSVITVAKVARSPGKLCNWKLFFQCSIWEILKGVFNIYIMINIIRKYLQFNSQIVCLSLTYGHTYQNLKNGFITRVSIHNGLKNRIINMPLVLFKQ